MARGGRGSVALARQLYQQRGGSECARRFDFARARSSLRSRTIRRRPPTRSASRRSIRRSMKRQAKVAVVMGGSSAERDISKQTGAGVLRALTALGYDATPLEYDERFVDAIRTLAPDVVFNALHGPGGEDGHVQALLDYLLVPYTGSGIEASALSMDKHLTKKLLAAEGLPTAAWDLFDLSGGTLPLLPGSLDPPLVVKPRFEGSAIGVVVVRTHEQWTAAMLSASKT